MDQALNSQKTPHTSPLRASYGMSFVSILMKNDRVIKGFYCKSLKHTWIKHTHTHHAPNHTIKAMTCRWRDDIDGLSQHCNISSALAMRILQSCTKPSTWDWLNWWGPSSMTLVHQTMWYMTITSHERHDISNHQPLDCLLKGLCSLTSKRKHQSSTLLGFCEGKPLVTCGFLSQETVMRKTIPCCDLIMLEWTLIFCAIVGESKMCLMHFVEKI